MIKHIHDTVDDTLMLYGHEDLISHHDLHVVDERPLQVCDVAHVHRAVAWVMTDLMICSIHSKRLSRTRMISGLVL